MVSPAVTREANESRISSDPEHDHIVCHCTDDNVAWCRTDVSDADWVDEDGRPCAMCDLVEETSPETCPWGCSCDEC